MGDLIIPSTKFLNLNTAGIVGILHVLFSYFLLFIFFGFVCSSLRSSVILLLNKPQDGANIQQSCEVGEEPLVSVKALEYQSSVMVLKEVYHMMIFEVS